MNIKEKLRILEDLMLIERDTLDEDMELSDINEWDSMAVISTIAMFDSLFGKDVTPEEIRKFKTVKDITDKME